ncbi:hypothetical protein [Streptomyces sp. MBT53]|uniref:hypothetical protein n=1 Tax=Streptomyces sp. MBT53 TaxID=1488384 RepID=UPI00191425DC|nr:hypothetical protein [Streptomyces sp. MBT53]MBK6011713.1 hypothetical protein [Streptomyces sp. MBT53]
MADPEHGLRRLVEEGTRAARQPPLADLRRRARRRRTFREVAMVTAVAAAVLAAFPLVARERSGTSTPGPTAPHTPQPTVTGPARPLLASPSETVPGGTITLTGTDCAPGKPVTVGIRWERGAKLNLSMEDQKTSPGQPHPTATAAGTYELSSVSALATGSFEARVKIPTTLVVNRPTLWARCQTPAPSYQLTQNVSIVVRSPYQ